MSRPVHPLGFKIADMDFHELWSLHHALRTVLDVVAGLQNQPRFNVSDSFEMNRAGRQLSDFREHVSCEMADIEDMVRGRVAADEDDQAAKFAILASSAIGPGDSPLLQVAELAQLAREAVR